MRASRSLDSPTSSGLTTVVSAATRSTSNDATITVTLATTMRSLAFMGSPCWTKKGGPERPALLTTYFELCTLNFLLSSGRSRRPFDVLRVLLVLLADVLHQLFVRPEASVERHGERLGVVRRIVDRRLDDERAQVRTRIAFDGMQL